MVTNLCEDFISFSLSSMSIDEKLVEGRPHGGISIMWRKSISNDINIVQYDDNRILGLEIKTNDFSLLFLCIYLPYECDAFYDDYCFYLNKLQCIIESSNTPYIFAMGDYNANIKSESVFGSELTEFCDLNNLCFIDKSSLSPDSYTFISQAHHTTSWLDHCISTVSGESIISNVYIVDDIVCSDHFPLCIDINCNISPICDSNFVKHSKNVCNWKLAGDLEKSRYYSSTDKLLSAVDVPIDAVMCRDANCELHTQDIDCFYKRIISCIKCAESESIPSKPTQSKFKAIPGWNDYVKEHHAVARDALWWWKFYNNPRQGPIYHDMKSARARFKYALRATKRAEETARADALANELCENDNDGFWKGVSKINQTSNVIASSIDGISGECNISVFWRDHFSSILNSSGLSNADLKNSIMSKLDDVQYSENMIVSSRVTSKLISELDSGKSSGPDNISPESLKFASNRLSVLLSLCFSVCLSHGYLPPAMIKTTIAPIVKNKCGNISESNNYRPIALATIISKLFESVLLVKCEDYLSTCSNQFGFKKGHSTDLCIERIY